MEPETLFALGKMTDPRFAPDNIQAWEAWVADIEAGIDTDKPCPEIYRKDQKTVLGWRDSGLGLNGVWQLYEK
jgi:hypothetical protein